MVKMRCCVSKVKCKEEKITTTTTSYMNKKKATQNKNSKERCASATIITTTQSPKIKLESAYFIAIFCLVVCGGDNL